MADNKIFVSPGVFTSEKDLSFVAQQVGVTTLGSVGETTKGPAFEPIFITNYNEFTTIFGGQNPTKFGNDKPKYELPYIAKSYLSQSNQMFVTRILGLTGYDAGDAWLITTSANYDPSTITSGSTLDWEATFSAGTYTFSGPGQDNIEYLESLGLLPTNPGLVTPPVSIPDGLEAYPQDIVFDKVGPNSFTGVSTTIDGATFDNTAFTGTLSGTVTTWSANSYTQYEGMVLAMLRSRGDYSVDQLTFRTLSLVMDPNGVALNPLADFVLSATTANSNVISYEVSMDVTKRNYITRVLGTEFFDKESLVFVEEHYPNLLQKLISGGYILGLNTSLDVVVEDFSNYKQEWQTPETPWVVSELRGNVVDKLFKFISISDGNSANKEIKISIQNIKPDTKEFDVVVRDYFDVDSKPSILERFSKCVMDPNSDNYVARRIGTADGEFSLRSRYIMIVENPTAPIDSFPAGFEGYIVRDYNSGVLAPEPVYKTSYDPQAEKIKKVYLGFTNTLGFDQNMFNWKGYMSQNPGSQWTATTKGFHMDSGATVAGDFEVGSFEFRTQNGIQGTNYESIFSRKFTFTPYLGFDGWNSYRRTRTNEDRYKIGKVGFTNGLANGEFEQIGQTEGTSDYYAYLQGIRTFANPEAVNINVFTTSNVEFGDNNDLVSEIVDMIEEERADSIYILSAPEGVEYDNSSQLTGLGFNSVEVYSAEEIVDFLDLADIDSNYTATYWPWIQNRDNENNVNIWLPPTYEVVRNIALTDNVSFPWFASAGYTRGLTSALQARVKLTEEDRDTLYEGRINPMATFSDQGVVIWGNKNLQIADSALDRLNIRRLLLQTRKLISAVAVRLLFEQNDQIVRNQFTSLVNPILENIKRERGLADFRVQLSSDPEEIDRNELRGKIFVKPVPSLEFIILEFNVTSTGASFDDI
jgi:phage tail sheath protein FI